MKFANASVYGPDFQFTKMDFAVENDRFIRPDDSVAPAEDLQGDLVLPGLIDIHIHGSCGADFFSGRLEDLVTIGRFLAQKGITTFSPTSAAQSEADLTRAYQAAVCYRDNPPRDGARLFSVTMEGPFYNPKKKGAMHARLLQPPDFALLQRLALTADGLLKITGVAPELPGGLEFIRQATAAGFRVSLGHTAADYDLALAAFAAGARQVTHLFNAMDPLLHRAPGVVGAAADSDSVMVEVISDGIHVHPSVIRQTFKMFGAARIILVSDSASATGLPEGRYGDFLVSAGKIVNRDGTIAGSVNTLFADLVLAVSFGIPLNDAIRCASYNPAAALGIEDRVGSIEPGKLADFLVCDQDLHLKRVYLGGKRIV